MTRTDPHDLGPASRWHLLAAACAWLVPGLGHVLIGQRRRGIILGVSIGALWLAGLLIGGVSCIEVRNHKGEFRPWFLGQMLIAPSVAVNWYHERLRDAVATDFAEDAYRQEKRRPPARVDYRRVPLPTDETIYFEPSYGRVDEQGVLYTALAGMLNLLAIIDVLYRDPKTQARQAGTHVDAGRMEAAT